MKPAITIIAFLLLAPAGAGGSGWNDYTLEIAPGFEVVRANTFQIGLATADGRILVSPELLSDDPLGPMAEFAVTPEFIFTRHHGARPARDNPQLREADPSRSFFFRVSRSDSSVIGPISRADWEANYAQVTRTLEWRKPSNPNFWLPLIGSVVFLLLSLILFGWPFLLALGGVIGLGIYLRRRRKVAA